MPQQIFAAVCPTAPYLLYRVELVRAIVETPLAIPFTHLLYRVELVRTVVETPLDNSMPQRSGTYSFVIPKIGMSLLKQTSSNCTILKFVITFIL